MRTRTNENVRATYRVPEAAQVAGTGTRVIRHLIADGSIPHIMFGRNILIPRVAFHRWLDSCGQTGVGRDSTTGAEA
jgi:excisionase family DNA binding protein